MKNITKIEGLIAATFTAFNEDGSINPHVIPSYAAWLKSQGVAGVFVNGSSGEGVLMSVAERKELAAEWAKHASEQFKVIIHVGSTSVEVAKDLAAHAQSLHGVFAIASMAPNFFPSSKIEVITDYCKQIALAASELPFYYYHLPVATGTHIKVHQFLKFAKAHIPTLAGVKYTYSDLMDMHQCINLDRERFDVLHGHDEILINGLVVGIKGAIGTTFNFIPQIYIKMMEAFGQQDLVKARQYQMKSIEVVSVMLRYGNAIVGGKAIMKLQGIDCGPCRVPLENLEAEDFVRLRTELEGIGYFNSNFLT